MLLRKVVSLLCVMTSLLLFATCPKSTPNGSLLSNLATDSGTFKLLGKRGGTYVLGHANQYITVVDTDDTLSALCLSNQTTLRAIRILANLKSPLRFTVEFQVKDPSFLNTARITLTDEQLKVLGTEYTIQLYNDYNTSQLQVVAVQYNSTILKRKNDSTANYLEPAHKRQNAQEIPLLPVVPLLPVTPNQGLCVLSPKAYNLHAMSFHPAIDSYIMNFSMPGQDRKIEGLISTSEILQFPNGKEAIQKYNDLHKPKKLPVAAPPIDHPVAVYFSFLNHT